MGLQSQWEEAALRACVASIGRLGIPATSEAAHDLRSFCANDLAVGGDTNGTFGSPHLREVALEATAQVGPMLDEFSRVGPVMRSGGLFVSLVTSSERMPAYIRTSA
jgi:hypothetical protein